jgi:hypothetical protein
MQDTQTNVEQTTVDDLDNLLGMPGADSIVTPVEETVETDEEAQPKFFQNNGVDTSIFDPKPAKPEVETPTENTAEAETPVENTETFEEIVGDIDTETEDSDDEVTKGRPKLDKTGMSQLTQKLIEKDLILPFEDEKTLEDYTMEDFVELFEVNIAEREKKVREQTPADFFDALPAELQTAARFVAGGGTDLKSLFKHLAASEEVKQLDPNTERGSEQIVRQYLKATSFGDDADIQEEIDSWKDLDRLTEKAKKFKPKLDAMQDKVIQQQVAEAESKKKQQQQASQAYMENVYTTLENGELNGVKLNSKTQNMLYAGLVQPNYPSISGKPTNLFGHLIEKYQFVEQRHDLIAEALWLLADPDGYKSEISKGAVNEQVTDTVRKLKTEQANKNTSTEVDTSNSSRKASRGIARPSKNFFGR